MWELAYWRPSSLTCILSHCARTCLSGPAEHYSTPLPLGSPAQLGSLCNWLSTLSILARSHLNLIKLITSTSPAKSTSISLHHLGQHLVWTNLPSRISTSSLTLVLLHCLILLAVGLHSTGLLSLTRLLRFFPSKQTRHSTILFDCCSRHSIHRHCYLFLTANKQAHGRSTARFPVSPRHQIWVQQAIKRRVTSLHHSSSTTANSKSNSFSRRRLFFSQRSVVSSFRCFVISRTQSLLPKRG